ncbi:ABC transporter permease [Pseudokineococcus lusitanus]|uniref:Iron(III) transport system permease protein n=1 Tax=Pseudokineococcus lusitanus TaxID=763993 RepID=A0A3N1HR27_9ACTN|nr:iron ABC transporter permease [Pseudokineococcus lusitanus]ROP44964.1 iron(III) transport system permease protein [Pseudokineococcus lusitanus]
MLASRADPAVLGAVLARPRTLELLLVTVALAAVVTAACLVVGVGTAWLLERTDLRGRRAWAVLAVLPLAVPSYVMAYTWVSALPGTAGFGGAALVLTLSCSPYVVLPVAASLRGLDPAPEEAARSLGLGPGAVALRVVLPQVRPAAASGGLLVAVYVLSDFGAVAIMRQETLTRSIATGLGSSFDRTPAVVLSLLLVALTVLVVTGESRSRAGTRYARLGPGSARTARPARLGRAGAPAAAALGLVAAAGLGLPLASIVGWLVVGRSGGLDGERLLAALGGSVGLAVGGAVLTTLAALPVGVLLARRGGRLARLLEAAVFTGHGVPSVVVALSLVFLTVRYLPAVYLTAPVVVVAYAVLFLPMAVGAVRASVAQSAPVLEDVARSLGRRPEQVLREVTVPLAAPGVAAGAALVLLSGMKELTATLMLHPTGTTTLALALWDETATRSYAAAAPYAAAVVLVSALPALLLGQHGRRRAGPPAGTAPGPSGGAA